MNESGKYLFFLFFSSSVLDTRAGDLSTLTYTLFFVMDEMRPPLHTVDSGESFQVPL